MYTQLCFNIGIPNQDVIYLFWWVPWWCKSNWVRDWIAKKAITNHNPMTTIIFSLDQRWQRSAKSNIWLGKRTGTGPFVIEQVDKRNRRRFEIGVNNPGSGRYLEMAHKLSRLFTTLIPRPSGLNEKGLEAEALWKILGPKRQGHWGW